VNDNLTSLVKQLDPIVGQNKKRRMSSVIVLLSDDESQEKALKQLSGTLKHISAGIDNPAGPKAWRIAKDADVTVILYERHQIKANHAFKKDQLDAKAIEKILADVPKIVPSSN
jgi:hypothetical protein